MKNIFIAMFFIVITVAVHGFDKSLMQEMFDYVVEESKVQPLSTTDEEFRKWMMSSDLRFCSDSITRKVRQIQQSTTTASLKCKNTSIYEKVEKSAPSIIIPLVYEALEGTYFDTNTSYQYSIVRKDSHGVAPSIYCSPWVRLCGFINCHNHCDAFTSETSALNWNGKLDIPAMTSDFWWYEGRKYMSQIWDQWYTCWKIEMASENVRTSVVQQLVREMRPLGMYVLPYVYEAGQKSDFSLNPLLNAISDKRFPVPLFPDFMTWYSTNSWKYAMPPCEGLEHARERLAKTNPQYVRELNGIIVTNNFGKDISHLGNQFKEHFKRCENRMREYFSNPDLVTNHWYYKIPSNIEYSAWDCGKGMTNCNLKVIETMKLMKRGKN